MIAWRPERWATCALQLSDNARAMWVRGACAASVRLFVDPVVRAALVGVMYEALIAGIVGPWLRGFIEGFQQQAEQMERAREQAEQCVEKAYIYGKGAPLLCSRRPRPICRPGPWLRPRPQRPGGVAWP